VRAREPRDEGYSMLDVVMTTAILSVVMVITLGAILQIYSAVNRTEGTSFARDQLAAGFRRLDKELRYATWVAEPGQVGSRWYLEYAIPGGCRQLVFGGGVLTLAKWTLPGTVPGTPAAIAGELTVPAGTTPFTRYAPRSTPYATAGPGTTAMGRNYSPDYVQVRVRFSAAVGQVSLPFDTVFTALNTSYLTPELNDCSKGRPAS